MAGAGAGSSCWAAGHRYSKSLSWRQVADWWAAAAHLASYERRAQTLLLCLHTLRFASFQVSCAFFFRLRCVVHWPILVVVGAVEDLVGEWVARASLWSSATTVDHLNVVSAVSLSWHIPKRQI